MISHRNADCPCGSGEKFKRCCGRLDNAASASPQTIEDGLSEVTRLLGSGRPVEAASLAERLCRSFHDHANAFFLAGVACHQSGRAPDAIGHLQRAVQLQPDLADWHMHLGILLNTLQRPIESLEAFERAAALEPSAQNLNNLGFAHLLQGHYEMAETYFRQILDVSPDMPLALSNLGLALEKQRRTAEALPFLQRSVELNANNPEALNNLAIVLRNLGRLNEASDRARQALRINPEMTAAHLLLSAVLLELGQAEISITHAQEAILQQPNLFEAHICLANALKTSGQYEECIRAASAAHGLNARQPDALRTMGAAFEALGRREDAVACYQRALEAHPEDLETQFRLMAASLPSLADSSNDIPRIRTWLQDRLDTLMTIEGQIEKPEHALFNLFPLAYHGEDDRILAEKATTLRRTRLPVLNAVFAPPAPTGKIRIGFVSSLFRNHTIGKLTIGQLRHLDRSRFHVAVINGPSRQTDDVSREIDGLADEVIHLPQSFEQAQRLIAAFRPDILHYPDIGMVPFTMFLAHARLAPVQTVTWGHPVTTGIDTVDYFLSFDPAEPDDAEAHYSERLIRLKRAPAFYDPFVPLPEGMTKGDYKLPESGHLYGCVQSLFKFHPDFDAVLNGIVTRDPSGWIVAIAGEDAPLRHQLAARWQGDWPRLTERVVFVPPMSNERFLGLISLMDVLLDTPHFGSGNTFYESLCSGTPTITWPGRFMRGRLVAGFYQWLGISNPPIAATLADYAPLAVEVANNRALNDSLRRQLIEAAPVVFSDESSVRELEDFFAAAVASTRRGDHRIQWASPYPWPSQEISG